MLQPFGSSFVCYLALGRGCFPRSRRRALAYRHDVRETTSRNRGKEGQACRSQEGKGRQTASRDRATPGRGASELTRIHSGQWTSLGRKRIHWITPRCRRARQRAGRQSRSRQRRGCHTVVVYARNTTPPKHSILRYIFAVTLWTGQSTERCRFRQE